MAFPQTPRSLHERRDWIIRNSGDFHFFYFLFISSLLPTNSWTAINSGLSGQKQLLANLTHCLDVMLSDLIRLWQAHAALCETLTAWDTMYSYHTPGDMRPGRDGSCYISRFISIIIIHHFTVPKCACSVTDLLRSTRPTSTHFGTVNRQARRSSEVRTLTRCQGLIYLGSIDQQRHTSELWSGVLWKTKLTDKAYKTARSRMVGS